MAVWILWVLIFADGEWRAWEHQYPSREACEEVRKLITHHRDDVLRAVCRQDNSKPQSGRENFPADQKPQAD